VLSEQATSSMNRILSQIPVIGTARRAALDGGIVTAGKTGTSQSYRDAWFIGFTGNYTTAVWFGNDDFTSMDNMTGGSLPAATFKTVMDYAHQGIELRAIPGIDNPLPTGDHKGNAVAKKKDGTPDTGLQALIRPRSLSAESTRLLRQIAGKLKEAGRLGPATAKVADKTATGSLAEATAVSSRNP
jgi:penicillin-binding protein 1A